MKRNGQSIAADSMVQDSVLGCALRRARSVLLLLILLPVLLPATARAALPMPDGFRLYSTALRPGSTSGGIKALAVQRDAKVVIGGDFAITRGGLTWNYLARVNPDGTLDTGFHPPALDGPVGALALHGEAIFVGGSFTVPGQGVIRLNSDGSLDGGFTLATTAEGLEVRALALQVDPADPLVLRGVIVGGVQEDALETKIPFLSGADGSGGLKWTYSFAADPGNASVDALLLLGGEILAGGNFTTPSASLARFTAGGGVLGGFGPASSWPGGTVQSLAAQADGKVVAGGDFSFSAVGSYSYLARFARDSGGVWKPDSFSPALDAPVAAIAVQPDGKILVAGEFTGRLARLKMADGAPDAAFAPPASVLDGVVNALCLQPDGKILAGGDFGAVPGASRTFLARFYAPHGSLDDDIPVLPAYKQHLFEYPRAVSQSPDGTITIGGAFQVTDGAKLWLHALRLKEDFTLDLGFTGQFNQQVMTLAPMTDDSLVVGGVFAALDTVWWHNTQRQLVRITSAGDPGPFAVFNSNANQYMASDIISSDFSSEIYCMTQLPRGTVFSDGTTSEDGMFYAGGYYDNVPFPHRYLARFFNDGTPDPRFYPVALANLRDDYYEIEDDVYAIAILPNGKVLVATYLGRLMKFDDTGVLEKQLQANYVYPGDGNSYAGTIKALTLERDGSILMGGQFSFPITKGGTTWLRDLVRLDADLNIDPNFNVETQTINFSDYDTFGAWGISAMTVQTDGKILITGEFNKVLDAAGGAPKVREFVARLLPTGELDPDFDLGHFVVQTDIENVEGSLLQPDGKAVLSGYFTGTINGKEAYKLSRYSVGWSSEELKLSEDGTTVSWLRGGAWQPPETGPERGGSGPELRHAWFEYSYDPDAPPGGWVFLGVAERIAGPERLAVGNGWKSSVPAAVQALWQSAAASDPAKAYLYLRARGYRSGAVGSAGSLVQSVRLSYLGGSGPPELAIRADDRSMRYGGDLGSGFSFTPAPPGIDGVTFSVTNLDGTPLSGAPSVAGSPYLITPSRATGTGVVAYQISYLPGILTITPAPLTVSANDAPPKRYGRSLVFDGTEFTSSGLQNGDGIDRVTLSSPGASPLANAAALPYKITPSNPTGLNFNIGNYAPTYLQGNLTVVPAPLTLAGDYAKSYGEVANLDPSRLTVSGLQNGESIGSVSLSSPGAAAAAPVAGSPYPIVPALSGGSFNPANYTVGYNGQLTVTRALLTFTAADRTRPFGAANPPLGALCTGFVNGESLAGAALQATPACSTAAGPESPVGPYPITVAVAGLAAPNYSFLGVNGTFTVVRADQSVTLPPLPATSYGAPDFNPGATSSSGLPVGYASSNPAVAVVVGGLVRITGAGTAVITASQAGDANHNPASQVATLNVAKAPLTVRAEDKARAYLTPNPQLTARYQGFVNGEDAGVLSGAPALATAALQTSPAGDYDIVASPGTLAAANYSFTPVPGVLSVLNSCQEIIFPPPADRTYGDPPSVIEAHACSGLSLSFASSDPQVATVAGDLLTVTGAGSVVISAAQQGNLNFGGATTVSRTITVHRSGQLLSFAPLPGRTVGDPPFDLAATASSGLPVGYLSSDPGVARVSGSSLSIVGAGTCVITALQPGNANYDPALPASRPLTVDQELVPPALSLSTLPRGAVTANPVLNIAGSAGDLSGIASLTVNGTELADQAALFSSAVLLSSGANRIEVVAQDAAGNRTTQTLNVTLDAGAPALSLSAPADNSVSGSANFTVSGSAAAGSSVSMELNGAAPQPLGVAADGSFAGSGQLAAGLNTVVFSASLGGRTSRVKRSVTLAPGMPSVAILEPAEDLRTEKGSITLRGSLGGGATGVTLTVGGIAFVAQFQGGIFQQTVALDGPGTFRVTASASDAAGNFSVARRNLVHVTRILGDLDGDGCVDLRDARAALRISLGIDHATAQALAHGDVAPLVNGVSTPDGVIDAGDVLVILRKIVGLADF